MDHHQSTELHAIEVRRGDVLVKLPLDATPSEVCRAAKLLSEGRSAAEVYELLAEDEDLVIARVHER